MFCPHDSAIQTAADEITCRACWCKFKNLGELAGDLSNQVMAALKAIRLLPAEEVVQVEYQDGQLVMDGTPIPLRGPETETECAQEWRELMAKQAREDSLALADRLRL
jgi:hypothetical protein